MRFGVKNFAITFGVSLLIFALLAYLLIAVVFKVFGSDKQAPTIQTSANDGSDKTPDDIDGSGDGGFNMLIIGTDYQPEKFDDYDLSKLNEILMPDKFPIAERKISADMIVFLHVDKKNGEFACTNIPSNTKVVDYGLTMTLSELYSEKGLDYFCDYIASIVGLSVDYRVTVTISGLESILSQIGEITYNVPTDMYYVDSTEGLIIDLTAGEQKLDAEKCLWLLRYNGYGDNGITRRGVAMNVFKKLLTEMTSSKYRADALTLWNRLHSYVSTDFGDAEFAENVDLIFSYPEMKISDITCPGSYSVYDGVVMFDLNSSRLIDAFKAYK